MARENIAETDVVLSAPSPGLVETTVGGKWLAAEVIKLHETGPPSATPSTAAIVPASIAV